jgi:6-phosphogluconolactonase (cycloisomerase 2 family)
LFSPDGRLLVVTEKASNTIDTFQRGDDGLLGALVTTASDGATPFGFDFDRAGHVIVSDAFGGAPGASALTAYRATDDGALHSIALVPNGQAAACWVVISQRSDAYVTNTGSGNVSSYSIGHDGTPTLLAADAATTGGHPTDEAIGHGQLFVLDPSTGRIVSASVQSSGGLGAVITGTNGLPASTVGLATATDH